MAIPLSPYVEQYIKDRKIHEEVPCLKQHRGCLLVIKCTQIHNFIYSFLAKR